MSRAARRCGWRCIPNYLVGPGNLVSRKDTLRSQRGGFLRCMFYRAGVALRLHPVDGCEIVLEVERVSACDVLFHILYAAFECHRDSRFRFAGRISFQQVRVPLPQALIVAPSRPVHFHNVTPRGRPDVLVQPKPKVDLFLRPGVLEPRQNGILHYPPALFVGTQKLGQNCQVPFGTPVRRE